MSRSRAIIVDPATKVLRYPTAAELTAANPGLAGGGGSGASYIAVADQEARLALESSALKTGDIVIQGVKERFRVSFAFGYDHTAEGAYFTLWAVDGRHDVWLNNGGAHPDSEIGQIILDTPDDLTGAQLASLIAAQLDGTHWNCVVAEDGYSVIFTGLRPGATLQFDPGTTGYIGFPDITGTLEYDFLVADPDSAPASRFLDIGKSRLVLDAELTPDPTPNVTNGFNTMLFNNAIYDPFGMLADGVVTIKESGLYLAIFTAGITGYGGIHTGDYLAVGISFGTAGIGNNLIPGVTKSDWWMQHTLSLVAQLSAGEVSAMNWYADLTVSGAESLTTSCKLQLVKLS